MTPSMPGIPPDQQETPRLPLATKVALWARVGFGLLVLFAFLGVFFNPLLAMMIMVITCVQWSAMQIISEAVIAWLVLHPHAGANKPR